MTQVNESDTSRVITLSVSEDLPNMARNLTAARLVGILDQAENGNTSELFALYRDVLCDSHIQAEFSKRKGAVLGDVRNLVPYDRGDQDAIAAKDFCFKLIESDDFYNAVNWLLNATIYPVAVIEKVFYPTDNGFALAALRAVPFQMLDLSYGTLRIFDVQDSRVQPTSQPATPERYIIHRSHNMPMPDRWGGPMRAILFWWLLRTMDRQWWASLLERFGTPFLKGEYKDDPGRRSLERAFSMASRLGGIVVKSGTRVDLERASAGDTSGSHEQFLSSCNAEISTLIVGQTLSSTPTPTGEIGGGTAGLQAVVRDDIRKADAAALAMTIRGQLLTQYCQINAQRGHPPIMIFGSDSMAETTSAIQLVTALGQAGLEPDDDGVSSLSERIGFGLRRKPLPMSPLPLSAITPRQNFWHPDSSPPSLIDLALRRYV